MDSLTTIYRRPLSAHCWPSNPIPRIGRFRRPAHLAPLTVRRAPPRLAFDEQL